MKPEPPKIIQDEQKPVAVEILADAIVKIAAAMKAIQQSRLNRRALVTLIHEESKIARRDIELVLNNLDALERVWLKPKQ